MMPVLNHARRFLVDQLAAKINQLVIGSDGTQASADDGGARALARIVPTVRVLDDQTILVEGRLGTTYDFPKTDVQEVVLQHKDASTGEFIPIYRTDIRAITKSTQNEIQFSFLIEVS
mgnify:CR=1 FL=1|tara:strand:+ start:215 stop:568 length:354 start_codon:yes stop_codon:yes gene_type:complete